MRLLVVDDQPSLAECLAEVLKLCREVTSVTTARSYEEGLQAALAVRPEVAILDEHLGESSKSGTKLAAELRRLAPEIRTIILTADLTAEAAARAMASGADGFVRKSSVLEELAPAVKAVQAGARYLDQAVAAEVATMRARSEDCDRAGLTSTESKILAALARGANTGQIAAQRGRSMDTIKTHLRSIYAKLDVTCRDDALKAARRLGLA